MAKRTLSSPIFLPLLLWLGIGLLGTAPVVAQAQQTAVSEQDEPNAFGQEPLTLTEEVLRDVLQPLQRGIEEHNLTQVLGVFDPQETPDYASLRDQLRAFFTQYDPVRFRYKLLQVTSEKDHAIAIAEIDMTPTPLDQTQLPVQRTTQMRFQMKLGTKGWKLVAFKPSDFFAQ